MELNDFQREANRTDQRRLGEVQRARSQRPAAAEQALARSQQLGFGYGIAHAAITLGLAGAITAEEAERLVADSGFPAPELGRVQGLQRFCLGRTPTCTRWFP